MDAVLDSAGLSDKLAAPFNAIVCRHRASLMPMLGGSAHHLKTTNRKIHQKAG